MGERIRLKISDPFISRISMNEFSYKGVHLKSENPCFIENSERDSEVRLEKEGEGRGGSIFEVEFLSFSDPFVL